MKQCGLGHAAASSPSALLLLTHTRAHTHLTLSDWPDAQEQQISAGEIDTIAGAEPALYRQERCWPDCEKHCSSSLRLYGGT